MNTTLAFLALTLYPGTPHRAETIEFGHHKSHGATVTRDATGIHSPGMAGSSNGCCQEPAGYIWQPQWPAVPPCGYFPVTIPFPPLPACQAQICVSVPADATLRVNGQIIAGNGPVRMLTTPALTPGRDHQYTLHVEYQADGATRVLNREVSVLGGNVSHVDFVEPTPARTVVSK